MSQSTRQFAKIEFIGAATVLPIINLQAVTNRCAPGLNHRRVYTYLFASWIAGNTLNYVQASVHFLRGGIESAVLPIFAMQTTNAPSGTNPGSQFSLAAGGEVMRDSLVLWPSNSVSGTQTLTGPLAGEPASSVLQPFYMDVDADEFQLNIDYALSVSPFRIVVIVFSDLLNLNGI